MHVRMRRACVAVAWLCVSGCMQQCSCGAGGGAEKTRAGKSPSAATSASPSGSEPGATAQAPTTGGAGVGATAAQEPAAAPSVAPAAPGAAPSAEPAAPGAAPATAPVVAAPPKPLFPAYARNAKTTEAFPELMKMPGLTSQLAGARTKGRATAKLPPSTSAMPQAFGKLALALPKKLDGMDPKTGAQPGPTKVADDMPISSVSQTFAQGDRSVYVNVTDTLRAPFMRESVLSRLDRRGTADQGFIHGRFVNGQPAVVQFYPDARSSQISVLVDDRYVVDVRVLGARSANDAQRIFESLPLSMLGK